MNLTVDGRRVFAVTGGKPFAAAIPAVVLVHGAGMDHSVWAVQTRALAQRDCNVLAVDLPGHGRSAGAALDTIGRQAEWLVALLDAAGVATAALVGHSMGGLAVLETAARHGLRVRGLALLGVAAAMPVHPGLLEAARQGDPAAIAMVTRWSFGRHAELGGAAAPGSTRAGATTALLERAAPGVLHADLAACDAYRDGETAAHAVRCPAVVVIGTHDRMTPPKAGHALAQGIAKARAVEIEAGHMMMVERPAETLDALAAII